MTTNHISSNNCFVIAHGRPLGPITIVGTWDNIDDAACYAETSIDDCKTNQYSIVKVEPVKDNNPVAHRYVLLVGDLTTGYELFGPFHGAISADLVGRDRWRRYEYAVLPIVQYAG